MARVITWDHLVKVDVSRYCATLIVSLTADLGNQAIQDGAGIFSGTIRSILVSEEGILKDRCFWPNSGCSTIIQLLQLLNRPSCTTCIYYWMLYLYRNGRVRLHLLYIFFALDWRDGHMIRTWLTFSFSSTINFLQLVEVEMTTISSSLRASARSAYRDLYRASSSTFTGNYKLLVDFIYMLTYHVR